MTKRSRWPEIGEQERFWRKVERKAVHECWPWLGSKNPVSGYGAFRVRVGVMESAHRYMKKIDNPHLRRAQQVLHTCDNKWCVNPAHLYVGDCRQNTQDALDRSLLVRDTVTGRFVAP